MSENLGIKAYKAGVSVTRYRRVKLDANGDVVHAGADEVGIGTALETVTTVGNHVPVMLWSAPGTRKVMVAGAVDRDDILYLAAVGKFDDAIGGGVGILRALEAATADGDIIEADLVGADGDHLISANVADSASITNTTTETDFDKKKTIDGGDLKVGDVFEIIARAFVVAANATDTLNLKLKVGTEIIAATGAVDVATNDIGYIHAFVVVRVLGASGKLSASGVVALGVEGTVTAKPFRLNEATEDISGASLDIKVTGTWSVANAGNDVILEDLIVIKHRQ